MAYIFIQRGLFPIILAYAIWNKHHKIAQLTLYLYIESYFLSFMLAPQALFLDFSEIALADGPEIHG